MRRGLLAVATFLAVVSPGSAQDSPSLVGFLPYGGTYAVAVSGPWIYYGVGSAFLVAEMSSLPTPNVVGQVRLQGGRVRGIAASGSYASVITSDKLHVVDVSTPSMPTVVGVWDVPASALAIAASGFHSYVLTYDGLHVVDSWTPSAPVEVGFLNPLGYVYAVTVAGSHVFLAGRQLGIRIVDVSTPTAPFGVRVYDTPGIAWDVAASGPLVYVADGSSGLRVIDVSTPTSPSEIGFCDTPAEDVALSGSYAYVADGSDTLQVINVTAPSFPVAVGSCSIVGYRPSVAANGSYGFAAGGGSGLRIIDVANPASPREVAAHDPADTALGVAVSGRHAYVAAERAVGPDWGVFTVVDVSTPSRPLEVGFLSYPYGDIDWFVSLEFAGSHLFVTRDDGLHVIDVSNPSAPSEVGVSYSDWGTRSVDFALSGSLAFVTDLAFEMGAAPRIRVVDVSTPTAPDEIATLFTGLSADPMAIAVSEPHAYVAYTADHGTDNGILYVYDMSSPLQLVWRGGAWLPQEPTDVDVAGIHAFVAADEAGLRIIEVSDPTAPTEVAIYDTPGRAFKVRLSGSCAFVADGDAGLRLIDITTPSAPVEVGHYDTEGDARDVAVSGSRVYVAHGYGLDIIDLGRTCELFFADGFESGDTSAWTIVR